jgi:hypothetical protein
MHPRLPCLICVLLVGSLAFCAGCTSPLPDTPPVTTPLAVLVATPITGVSLAPVPIPIAPQDETTSAVISPSKTPVTPTWIPKPSVMDSAEDPYIFFQTTTKEALVFDIPDCGMRATFPEAAEDPAYGIVQTEPRLIMVTPEEMTAFLAAHKKPYADNPDPQYNIDPNLIGGAKCAGAVASPTWNFIRINATFVPRNSHPAVYDIGINFRSHGRIIEQLQINSTFVLDQPIIIARYIPLTNREMDQIDMVDYVFAKRG